MIACVDVDYREHRAVAACVMFEDWAQARPSREWGKQIAQVADYVPGQFYRRELPCLLAVLKPKDGQFDIVVVDGYVWLDSGGKPGLGAHLYDALEGRAVVIGVAKAAFNGATMAAEVRRGGSQRPLYVTSAGIDVKDAADHIAQMHGEHRVPTLLKRVDRLCRGS